MNRADWRRIRPLLETILDHPTETRADRLAQLCGDDEDLRRQVEEYIQAAARDTLDGWIPPWSLPEPEDELPETIGGWTRGRRIGRGGAGSVYQVWKDNADGRTLGALKILHASIAVGRFQQERRILSELRHPAIPALLDGGWLESGQPYIVLEFVEGTPLDDYAALHELSAVEKVRLVRQVAEAVEAAHRQLIVHRDIKPSNILVTAKGDPKLIDFGIAKVISPFEAKLTMAGAQGPMTYAYAAPEQVLGHRATPAVDIYALGVVLFQLLTGSLPYAETPDTLESWRRVICDDRPLRLTECEPVNRALRGDLTAITARCLEKDPDRRYRTVGDLIADLRAYEDGLPVMARRGDRLYRAGKFLLRHWLPVAALAAMVVALAFAIHNVIRARDEARSMARSLVHRIHDSVSGLSGAAPVRLAALEEARRYLQPFDQERVSDPDLAFELAQLYGRLGGVYGEAFDSHLSNIDLARKYAARSKALADSFAHLPRFLRDIGGSRLLLGDIEFGHKNWLEALKWYQEAEAVLAANPAETERQGLVYLKTVAQSMQGDTLVFLGRPSEALAKQMEVLQVRRRRAGQGDMEAIIGVGSALLSAAQAHAAMGLQREAIGDLDQAVASLKVAASTTSRELLGRRNHLIAEIDVERYRIAGDEAARSRAIAFFERTLTADPYDERARYMLRLIPSIRPGVAK